MILTNFSLNPPARSVFGEGSKLGYTPQGLNGPVATTALQQPSKAFDWGGLINTVSGAVTSIVGNTNYANIPGNTSEIDPITGTLVYTAKKKKDDNFMMYIIIAVVAIFLLKKK